MILLLKIISRKIDPIVFPQVSKINSSSQIFIFFFIEDSQGNINPYAVTSYTMNDKDENDHESFSQLETTGMHKKAFSSISDVLR